MISDCMALIPFLARGLGPIGLIWDNILKWEIALSNKTNIQISGSLGVLQFVDICLDFTEMRRQLDQSIKLLSTAHCIILDRHRL